MQRLPPHQRQVTDLPVLHVGSVPEFDRKTWDFRVEGHVEKPIRLSYDEILALDRTICVSDLHCVMGWSMFDLRWEGVRFSDIAEMVKPRNIAQFVTIESDGGYSTSLSLTELMGSDVLFAYDLDGRPLEPDHGGPLRIVVPKKYAYKSAKWVRRVIFTEKQEPGFWEKKGYSNTADPWREERYSDR